MEEASEESEAGEFEAGEAEESEAEEAVDPVPDPPPAAT